MTIEVRNLTLAAGPYFASIDPPALTLDIPGGMALTGGSEDGAYALISGDSVSIQTSTLNLAGGAGNGSFAGIQALSGSGTIVSNGGIEMIPGTGQSSGAWMTAAGPLSITTVNCNGCSLLPDDPFASASGQAGLFGNPVTLTLPVFAEVPSSVIVGVQTAETGAEAGAGPDEEQEEEAEEKQAADGASPEEEQKSETQLQLCM
jgi:hypothetical protein